MKIAGSGMVLAFTRFRDFYSMMWLDIGAQ
jgi:hypothetical protein